MPGFSSPPIGPQRCVTGGCRSRQIAAPSEKAASIASLLLTTEALVTVIPEDKSAAAPAMPHGDMY